jgi:predicted chitinase
MNLYTGCVENRKDPLRLGRCQVRIVGIHTHDKTILPTENLPWAFPIQPINSAAISGIGISPTGVVEGTWVVLMFRDEDQQQPIILGSIGGIPQDESKDVSEDEDESLTIDTTAKQAGLVKKENEAIDGPTPQRNDTIESGLLVTSDGSVVTDGSGNPIRTGSSTNKVNAIPPPLNVKGVRLPPPDSANQGIAALNKAMDAAGVTGKYARAAILGIVGGESAWVPQNEGHVFKKTEALVKTFPRTFANKPDVAIKYTDWKGSKDAFFNFVYSPENNGKLVGNTLPDDGGKFYGKGFIQLTGRPNYTRYARLSGVNILDNPNILNEDYDASARVAVAYFIDRVKTPYDDPSYMERALRAVGNDAGNGYDKKRAYYQYFLGDAVSPPEQTDKSTAFGSEAQGIPVNTSGVPLDREKNVVVGFSDPNMKYPLRQYIGEPDTNRLARGNIVGTAVEFKDSKIMRGIKTAAGKTWDQPNIPFNAQYPFNKVMESESGHLMEFDDTPENERIHLYHRKGTFLEIDVNGTQVNRIVGDGYEIIERNGYIYIGGSANVTIAGQCNILIQSDANIDITGDTNLNMAGNANFNVANDMSINVGGEFKVKAANIKAESTSDVNIKATGANKLTSGANFEVNAAGRANIEGSTVHWAQGAASADGSGLGGAITKGEKNTQQFEPLAPPPRALEEDMEYETPEENELEPDKAKAYSENRANSPDNNSPTVTPPADAPREEKPDNNVKTIAPGCDAIYAMTSYPASYVLHTDSTGYAWTIGTVTRSYSLTPGRYGLGLGRGQKEMSIQEIVCNLKGLCVNILGPLNENFGRIGKAWNLNSCYRNNIPTGGSATSQHLSGSAVDISMGGNFGYKLMFDAAKKIAQIIPYDQLLLEYRDRNDGRINWIHISNNNYGPPKKDLRTFLNDKTHTAGSLVYLGK